jgi:hypothetical protein
MRRRRPHTHPATTPPEREPQSRTRRAVASARQQPPMTHVAGLTSLGSGGFFINGFAQGNDAAMAASGPGLLPIVAVIGAAIWKYGLVPLVKRIVKGPEPAPAAGRA